MAYVLEEALLLRWIPRVSRPRSALLFIILITPRGSSTEDFYLYNSNNNNNNINNNNNGYLYSASLIPNSRYWPSTMKRPQHCHRYLIFSCIFHFSFLLCT